MNPASVIQAGAGAIQTLTSLIGRGKLKRNQKAALDAYQTFKTPEEVVELLQATQMRAGNGLGSETLDFLTEQTDRAASGATGAAMLLGGNPNDLSAIFDQKMNSIMKIGAENQAQNIKNFTQYLTAMGTMADNKTAEQLSEQQKQKNYIQAASAALGENTKSINEGLNNVLGGVANQFTSDLYNEADGSKIQEIYGSDALGYAKKNNMSFKSYQKKANKIGGALSSPGTFSGL